MLYNYVCVYVQVNIEWAVDELGWNLMQIMKTEMPLSHSMISLILKKHIQYIGRARESVHSSISKEILRAYLYM